MASVSVNDDCFDDFRCEFSWSVTGFVVAATVMGAEPRLCYLCNWKAFQELVAQLVEQRTFNAWVSGSIPDELTTRWPPTLFKTTSNAC